LASPVPLLHSSIMSGGKFDPGYSFRSSDFRSQPDRWQKRGTALHRSLPPLLADDGEDEDGKRLCSNGVLCHAATRSDDGEWTAARTFQNFCPACRPIIATRLAELPEACVKLIAAIGDRPRTGKAVRVAPGPREPIRLEVDALVRLMGWVLGSWHERIARVFSLTAPEVSAVVIQHPERAVRDAVRVIFPPGPSDRVDALLAFPREHMARVMYDPAAAEEWLAVIDPAEAGTVTLSGEAWMTPRLSGVHAGREILELHHRARRILGEVRAPAETFDGVPCRACEAMSLERAEPPSDPKRPADHSRCAECGDTMDRKTFDEWVAWYEGWAKAATGLTCRRCQKAEKERREHDCTWAGCACRARGHAGSRDEAA
jgi:hypothetical protein